jgi:prolyl-tRNA synthetase
MGPRDLAKRQVIAVSRLDRTKEALPLDDLETRVPDLLAVIQKGIYDRALKFRQDNTRPAGSYSEFKEQIESLGGFFEALWCGDSRCETKIKEETKATIRCIPLEGQDRQGACLCCGSPAQTRVYLARAY